MPKKTEITQEKIITQININADFFYANLHGQKVVLCVNNDVKIKNNQLINNNKNIFLKLALTFCSSIWRW